MQSTSRFWRSQSGNVALYFALALVPILILIGGMIDMSRTSNGQQELQYALDAAVLAGARDGEDAFTARASTHLDLSKDGLTAKNVQAHIPIRIMVTALSILATRQVNLERLCRPLWVLAILK